MFVVLLSLALSLTEAPAAPAQAPLDCRNASTTIDLDECAGRDRDAAQRSLRSALASHPVPERTLSAWRVMRAALCDDLAGELYRGGSISSMVQTSCEARLTWAWARRIVHPPVPATSSQCAAARREMSVFVQRYRAHVGDAHMVALFDRAQSAWRAFVRLDMRHSGGGAEASLDRERVADLKSIWVGERFW